MDQLVVYGWTEAFREKWDDLAIAGMQPARVIADFGTSLKIATVPGIADEAAGPRIMSAELSGKLAHHSNREYAPKVGDWVAIHGAEQTRAVIESVIPRRNEIARKVAGNRALKQVIAANVDIAFVIIALDNDFSIDRLKRFLYQLSQYSIETVIVLNKADKTDDVESYVSQLRSLNVPIIISIATASQGIDDIVAAIGLGRTAVLLGSSGVGKSTLTNQLLGRNAQATQEVRLRDDTGKHTTVHRELFVLPGGGLLIDTPGIRELQLWGTEEALDENFDDVALIVSRCKYASCSHTSEAGCAVRTALENGELNAAHYASYLKMKGELVVLGQRSTVRALRSNQRSRRSIRRQDRDRLTDDY